MRLVFRDVRLELVMTDRAHESGLSAALIQSLRKKIVLLQSAPDERTLRNWRSLHYEKLQGDRSGQKSIRLNDQWRLILIVHDETQPASIELIEVCDYH